MHACHRSLHHSGVVDYRHSICHDIPVCHDFFMLFFSIRFDFAYYLVVNLLHSFIIPQLVIAEASLAGFLYVSRSGRRATSQPNLVKLLLSLRTH